MRKYVFILHRVFIDSSSTTGPYCNQNHFGNENQSHVAERDTEFQFVPFEILEFNVSNRQDGLVFCQSGPDYSSPNCIRLLYQAKIAMNEKFTDLLKQDIATVLGVLHCLQARENHFLLLHFFCSFSYSAGPKVEMDPILVSRATRLSM